MIYITVVGYLLVLCKLCWICGFYYWTLDNITCRPWHREDAERHGSSPQTQRNILLSEGLNATSPKCWRLFLVHVPPIQKIPWQSVHAFPLMLLTDRQADGRTDRQRQTNKDENITCLVVTDAHKAIRVPSHWSTCYEGCCHIVWATV